MGYTKTNTRSEILTPELAKQVSSMPGLLGEREIRPIRIKFLKTHIKGRTFVGPNWAIAVHKDTGDQFRINGQHSSHALAEIAEHSPDHFPQNLYVTIDMFEFDDMVRDAPGLFNLFDNPRSARTDTDFMGITRATWNEFADMDNLFLVKVASGIDINVRLRAEAAAVSGMRMIEIPLAHREHGLHFNHEHNRQFAVWLYEWKNAKHFGFVGKAGVTSELLNDWRQSPEIATEFWDFVFYENHPDPEHESRELVRELLDLDRRPRKVPTAEYQSKTRKFWHKYYRFRRAEFRAAERAVTDIDGRPPDEVPFLPNIGEVDRPPAQL
jgi:hypothetical protein